MGETRNECRIMFVKYLAKHYMKDLVGGKRRWNLEGWSFEGGRFMEVVQDYVHQQLLL
jgi:hypothetical protein